MYPNIMFSSSKYILIVLLVQYGNCIENFTSDTKSDNMEIPQQNATVQVKDTKICIKCDCYQTSLLLDCSNRNIKDIIEWFTQDEFRALQHDNNYKFETYNFERNQLTEVPVLPALINLKSISFHNNKIEKIASGAFTKLIGLKKLDLSHNLLTSKALDAEVFKGKYNPHLYEPMKNLTDLNLSANKLHSLQQDIFSHFPRIEVLNLSSNSFQHIDDLSKIAISSLGYITEIDLSYMELSDLPKFLFNYHKNDLKILKLNGNKFDKVPSEAISKATNLEVLYLDENPFITFDEYNNFPILPNLKELYISNCPNLTKIGQKSFSGLQNLTKLFITNNPSLKTIHSNSLAYFKANSLNISYPPLQSFSLENNQIEILPPTLIGNWTNINIDLRNNPWICSCKNDFLINKLLEQIIKDSPQLSNNINCNKPEKLKGVPLKNFTGKNGIKINCTMPEESSIDSFTIITSMLVGILISLPLAYVFLIIYRRGCFGFVNSNDPAKFSRAFYSRTTNDEFM